MKSIKYIFLATIATVLMAADCSNKDSEFYNDVFATVPNLVTVAESPVPEIPGLFVTASIPKLLTVAGLSQPLDIFRSTGGATKLLFSYEIEKEISANNWEYVEIASENILSVSGESQVGSFVLGNAVLNSGTNIFEYQAVIQNLSAGNYRLSFGYNSQITNLVEFRSQSTNNNLFLNLESPVTFLDINGYYYFTAP